MTYSKGLHILAEIDIAVIEALTDYAAAKLLLQKIIEKHRLTIVSEVFTNFEGGGFTGVYCLTESHILIHTWPAFERVTYDVFLSNFRNNNEAIVRDIHKELVTFFQPTGLNLNELYR